MKTAEVLSPAGSSESLEAAVRSGADAVYIGAKRFSARRNAENFDGNGIEETVKYCHIRGVKVYLALNIMIKQSELYDSFMLAKNAYEYGVDAIIISDLGLARLIHENIPDMPLHASTQMTVHSKSALVPLKRLGFSRVVVSREMSKSELQEFCAAAKELNIEVEMFVHGALCMSVSGQCLLSSVLGGRSGNRGLCAGPCRLPFTVDGGTGYDLSLKDLCLYKYIGEILKAGVYSLKIEGRMKRPEYIAAATAACKQAVDNGTVDSELFLALQNVFSRSGFTDGYYKAALGREMFGVRTKDDVVSATTAFSYIHNLYRAERQSVPITFHIEIKTAKPITLKASDGTYTVSVNGQVPLSAQNKPTDENTVYANLSKLGNTPYFCDGITSEIDDGLYVSASVLNALRRDAVFLLNEKRSQVKIRRCGQCNPSEIGSTAVFNGNKKFVARFADIKQMPNDLSKIAAIILPYECEFPKSVCKTVMIAELPRYITDESVVEKRLIDLKKQGIEYAYCSNLSALEIAKKVGFKTVASFNFNIYNGCSVKTLEQLGADAAMLSAEISLKEIKNIPSNIPIGIFGYGRLPLMLTRNCPAKNGKTCAECNKKGVITDRKNIKFPIVCRCGYSEVLNSKPLYMGDRLSEIPNVDFLLMYFTDENSDKVAKILNMYKNSLPPDEDYTRNLYYRDLI